MPCQYHQNCIIYIKKQNHTQVQNKTYSAATKLSDFKQYHNKSDTTFQWIPYDVVLRLLRDEAFASECIPCIKIGTRRRTHKYGSVQYSNMLTVSNDLDQPYLKEIHMKGLQFIYY